MPTSASGDVTASSWPVSPSASCRWRRRCSPRRRSPAYAAFINVPPRRLLVGLVLYPLLLSIPLTTAYAVVVHRVMDVQGAGATGRAVCAGPLHDRRAGGRAGRAARRRPGPQSRPDDRRAVHDLGVVDPGALGRTAARPGRAPAAARARSTGCSSARPSTRARCSARSPRRRARRAATRSTPCARPSAIGSAARCTWRRPMSSSPTGRPGGCRRALTGCARCRWRAGSPLRSRRGRIRW